MSCEVAFLRAINVGGWGVVRMADLVRVFEAAGAESARTCIQSGNVLFLRRAGVAAEAYRRRVAAALVQLLGRETTVVYRSGRDLVRLAASEPFGAAARERDAKLYVGLLASPPKKLPKPPLVWAKDGLEIVGRKGSDVFVVSRRVRGGRYGFPNALLESIYGVPATSRNWNTVVKIAEMAEE
jgi:uncharacterized protein (DUF1697 family)